MKLAIVGSRTFDDPEYMEVVLNEIPGITQIISGGASGADTYAAFYAARKRIPLLVFPADWKKYGKAAGFQRNNLIIAACDEVVAFWDGLSNGTFHSIQLAYKAKKPVRIFWRGKTNKKTKDGDKTSGPDI